MRPKHVLPPAGLFLIACIGFYAASDGKAPATVFAAMAAASMPTTATGRALPPEQQKAVDRGLSWLASKQGPDGAMTAAARQVGITGLASLAFMASGSTLDHGPYSKNVRLATDYILSCVREDGYITAGQCSMYDHAFGMLALAQADTLATDKKLKERIASKLAAAVALTQQAQGISGGWRYQPKSSDADVVVTACQLLGLYAARTAGAEVNPRVIDRAMQYIQSCQAEDGGFTYTGVGASNWVRTCVATAVMGYLGPVDGASHEKAMASMREAKGLPKDGFPLLGCFFMKLALSQAGGDDWDTLSPSFARLVLERQQPTGEWNGEGDSQCATAIALLRLQYPTGHLSVLAWKPLPAWEQGITAPTDQREIEVLWNALATDDFAKAYRAQAAMVAGGEKTVAFLREKLKPVPAQDEGRIAKLIADLDSDDFATRDKASKELLGLGSRAEVALDLAAKESKSAEVRVRAADVLSELLGAGGLSQRRQSARAIRTLARIGSPDAIEILMSLAKSGQTVTDAQVARSALASTWKTASAPAKP